MAAVIDAGLGGGKTTTKKTTTTTTQPKSTTPVGSVSTAVVAGRADPVPSSSVNTNNSYYTVSDGTNRTAVDSKTGSVVGGASGTVNTPTPEPSYGGSSGATQQQTVAVNNYYDDLLEAFMNESKAARDSMINAIMANLDSIKGTYRGQIQDITDEYDRLVNENEVRKDRARRVIRENQANRGQLDSGLGRQEQLNMNIGYDNITSNLNSARTKAVNDILALIAQAEAEAETNKANANNNYANSLLQFRLANS